MENNQSVLDSIYALYDTFYEQEKKIANYIINNYKAVINMTISELAAQSGTSVATVTRFCKKCGVEGFHHLKIGLARDIVTTQDEVPVSGDISQEDIEGSLKNILGNKIEELRQTISSIDPKTLEDVLAAIRSAGIVQFVAVGNTIPAALDGAFKFNEIGIKAVSGTIWETQLAFTLNLGPGDVLIAISNSGESRHDVKMVAAAKKNGVTTVGITNNVHSEIGSAVDYHFTTATREKLFLDEFCFSRISAMTVVEVLYLFLTVGKTESYEKLSACEHLIADEKA